MNDLDRFMEFLVAAIFLLVGLSKIFRYKYPRGSNEVETSKFEREFPYWCVALLGMFEMAAATALVTPFELNLFAAVALAFSTFITVLYRASVQKPAAPTAVLFLLVLFVICGRV